MLKSLYTNTWTRRQGLLLCLLITNAIFLKAQTSNIYFTSLASGDGLSSNTVFAIHKDKQGFMWFATEDGLNKFDGINFTIYRNKPSNRNSLPVNEITCLHEDRKGRLWIGTNGGSVSWYDRKYDNFHTIPGNGRDGALSSAAITSITSDKQGDIWIGTFGGLNVLNPVSGKIRKFSAKPADPKALVSNAVSEVYADSKGDIWVGTDHGLHRYNHKSGRFTRFLNNVADPASISNNAIRIISEDSKGNLWVGTERGLNVIYSGTRSFKRFWHSAKNANSITSDYISAISDDGEGSVWVGTEEGISIINTSGSTISRVKPDRRNSNSLTNKSIRSIFIDDQHIHWIGTYQGGVNIFDKNLSYFSLKTSNSFDPYGLRAPVVTSFEESDNGDVFVGTDGGGLQVYQRKADLFKHLDFSLNSLKKSSELSVLALLKTKKKHLWVATYNEGVIIYDLKSGAVKHLKEGPGTTDLNSNDVFCLEEDSRGQIWIGTNGGGINIYNPDNQQVIKLLSNADLRDPKFPSNNNIRAFAEDRSGNMWIATYGGGICVYNLQTHIFKFYDKGNSHLPGDVILSLLFDKKNRLWVGTLGGGLCCMDPGKGDFVVYSEKQGLANNLVQKILEDDQGNIWMSTNKGLSRFVPGTKTFKNYSHHNGIQQGAFMIGAGLKLSTGELFFGGFHGFNFFNPVNLKINKVVPRVVFTDLKISGKSVAPLDEGSPIRESIGSASEIVLDYKQSFSLAFAALNYTSSKQNQYAYKLKGFDKDWNYAGNNPTVNYTSLNPGEYVFQVKASNNDGVWNEKGASIKITIRPPFWRSNYAYFLYTLLFVGALFYIRHRGIKKLKRDFALEQERTQARALRVQERKDAEQVRELDLLKLKFLTNLSHEFRTPISLIMAPVEKMLSQKGDKETFTQLQMIKRNARRLLNLVNQLLDFRKMEEQELRLNKSDGDIVAFIREVSDSFVDLAERKNITYSFRCDLESLYASFDRDKIERILFNLLSNAFKFTFERGEVTLELHNGDIMPDAQVWLKIKVIDTGIGISKERQEQVFDRFFQDDISTSILNQGSGIGLSITREFVNMHGGRIYIESEPGLGSTFTVELPFMPILPPENTSEPLDEVVSETEDMPDSAEELLAPDRSNMPHILIVEDNADFRFYLKDNLRNFYRISEAADGKQGWQKALALHPHLIVSDITMPVMDGIELCRKVKSDKRTNHIPVILLTAITGEEEQIKGLETGASDYMTKPFNFEILNSKIRNLLTLQAAFKNTYIKQIKVQSDEPQIESEDAKFLNSVVRYIEENLTNERLSVEELSQHIFMSRGTLYRRVLNLTGETPVEFIRSVKLERAKILLEKADMTVAQVAYTVGFGTPNYFAKAFKAKYNMSPSEYVSLKKR